MIPHLNYVPFYSKLTSKIVKISGKPCVFASIAQKCYPLFPRSTNYFLVFWIWYLVIYLVSDISFIKCLLYLCWNQATVKWESLVTFQFDRSSKYFSSETLMSSPCRISDRFINFSNITLKVLNLSINNIMWTCSIPNFEDLNIC